VDTADSVQSLIRALAPLNPQEINLIAVHALFSPPAEERISALIQEGLLKRIIVTDTVYCPGALSAQLPNLEIVPSAGLSARIIRTIASNAPMSMLFNPFHAGTYFKSPNLFNI
jgi:ribose-phosphate pyrophosphokinase